MAVSAHDLAPAAAFDVERVRHDFPILARSVHGRPLAYLDSAASSQRPLAVIRAVDDYERHSHANVHRGVHLLSQEATAAYEGARERVRRFLNARSSREILFVRGTTEAINLVAQSYARPRLGPGDEILITGLEHHANIVPWQMVREQTGCSLVVAPINRRGEVVLPELIARLSPRTRIVSVAHLSNALGTVLPVREIVEMSHARGIPVLIDGAQSAPRMPVDVQEIGCDFLALSGHKMCGPTGIGVLYGRQEILETISPYQGGGEMILSVTFQKSTWKNAPHRFEAGTPDISGAVGLHAAMDYLDRLGRQKIAEHDQELGAYAYEKLAGMKGGIRLFGPHIGRAGVVSFLLPDVHAHDVVTAADQGGVALRGGHHCNQPLMHKLGVESTARASFYFYNTTQEIDRFVEVLSEIQRFFGV